MRGPQRETEMPDTELYEAAVRAAEHAYVPFSRFPVGAALRMRDGDVVVGSNVDNASYPLTQCAERNAVGTALASGRRGIRAVAVHGDAYSVPPCGGCRQVLAEHAEPECTVTFLWHGRLTTVAMGDLLPYPFELISSHEPT